MILLLLTSKSGRRSFEIYDNNWNFLMGLLSHNLENADDTLVFSDNNTLITEFECGKVANNIQKLLKEHAVYEIWDGVKVEPIVDPTQEMLKIHNRHIQPISDKRKNFLLKLSNFLENSKELRIT